MKDSVIHLKKKKYFLLLAGCLALYGALGDADNRSYLSPSLEDLGKSDEAEEKWVIAATCHGDVSSVQLLSRVQLFANPWTAASPGFPVHHQLLEITQTHVHRVGDAIQPSHPLSSPSPPAPNPSQHQSFPMSQLFT